jgi:hypothetical protein
MRPVKAWNKGNRSLIETYMLKFQVLTREVLLPCDARKD